MNKQMKVILIVLAILSTTTIVAYAAPPTTPNITELLQNIMDSIDDLASLLSDKVDTIDGVVDTIDGKVDTIDGRLAGVPVMEFFSGHVSGTRTTEFGHEGIWDSSDYGISSGAIFHVVVYGSVSDDAGSVVVATYIDELPVYVGTAYYPFDDGYLVLEFTGSSCEIYAYVPEGVEAATYDVYYAVSVTYVPES